MGTFNLMAVGPRPRTHEWATLRSDGTPLSVSESVPISSPNVFFPSRQPKVYGCADRPRIFKGIEAYFYGREQRAAVIHSNIEHRGMNYTVRRY